MLIGARGPEAALVGGTLLSRQADGMEATTWHRGAVREVWRHDLFGTRGLDDRKGPWIECRPGCDEPLVEQDEVRPISN